jgi:hypothetical protein
MAVLILGPGPIEVRGTINNQGFTILLKHLLLQNREARLYPCLLCFLMLPDVLPKPHHKIIMITLCLIYVIVLMGSA